MLRGTDKNSFKPVWVPKSNVGMSQVCPCKIEDEAQGVDPEYIPSGELVAKDVEKDTGNDSKGERVTKCGKKALQGVDSIEGERGKNFSGVMHLMQLP